MHKHCKKEFSHSVTSVSTVRAFPLLIIHQIKRSWTGVIGAGLENPRESSHGGHGGFDELLDDNDNRFDEILVSIRSAHKQVGRIGLS